MKLDLSKLFFQLLSLSFIVFLFSCTNTKKVSKDFLNFNRGLDSISKIQFKESVIKQNDVLSIQISSKSRNQEQAAIFNLPGNTATTLGYQVNYAGSIELPLIGNVKAAGLTKTQLESLLEEKLSPYVKDPLVQIKFLQFTVNVLGEVHSPGTKTFQTDKVSIIDVISASGDITDYGKKDNVMVIREENGKRTYYNLDLRSGGVFQSPAYYIQPNDIVYVEPNETRLKQVGKDPEQRANQILWRGYLSIGITLLSLAITLSRL